MRFPIGIQSFEKLIKAGYLYVDKTELIYKMVDTGNYYFLSRPRRFGKSLLVSTIEAYFTAGKRIRIPSATTSCGAPARWRS